MTIGQEKNKDKFNQEWDFKAEVNRSQSYHRSHMGKSLKSGLRVFNKWEIT